jgi:uncharacterized protein YkwD
MLLGSVNSNSTLLKSPGSNAKLFKSVGRGCALFFALWLAVGCAVGQETNSSSPVAQLGPTSSLTTADSDINLTTTATTAVETIKPSASNLSFPFNLDHEMLALINGDRTVHGLLPVAWDTAAATAARRHAEDMIAHDYFSHWNLEGMGPDYRYTQVGGQHAAFENLHAFSYTYSNGRGAPIEDWSEVVSNAQTGFMNSPGHRANILDPARTHVGIGMAHDEATGQFRLVQMFTNQYIFLAEPLPLQARLGETINLNGHFMTADLTNILLSLAYEPEPQPLTIAELNQTSTYHSPAERMDARLIETEFAEQIVLQGNGAGHYHIRIFAELAGRQIVVLDHIVVVR